MPCTGFPPVFHAVIALNLLGVQHATRYQRPQKSTASWRLHAYIRTHEIEALPDEPHGRYSEGPHLRRTNRLFSDGGDLHGGAEVDVDGVHVTRVPREALCELAPDFYVLCMCMCVCCEMVKWTHIYVRD